MIEYVNGIPRADYLEIIRKTEEASNKRIKELNKRGDRSESYIRQMRNLYYGMYSRKFENEYWETHRKVES